MDRKQIDYNKIVGRKDGLVYVLDYVFDDGDGFKGATGNNFELLTEKGYEERKNMVDVEECWKMAVEGGYTKESLADFEEEFLESEENILDLSYCNEEYIDEAKKIFGELDGEEYLYSDCSGGGRCFDLDMCNPERRDDLINPELLDIIKQYETK